MNKNNKVYTYDNIIGEFNKAVDDFKNAGQRIPSRSTSPSEVEQYASKLHYDQYRDVLHPSVIDKYRTNYAEKQGEDALALKNHMDKVNKRRNDK